MKFSLQYSCRKLLVLTFKTLSEKRLTEPLMSPDTAGETFDVATINTLLTALRLFASFQNGKIRILIQWLHVLSLLLIVYLVLAPSNRTLHTGHSDETISWSGK
jgi:hypothetical protein